MGWGGEAKGCGNGKKRHDFGGKAGPGRGHYSIEGEARVARHERHAEEMREILYEVAHTAEQPSLQIQAADKLLNRIEGLPVAKVVTAETDPYSRMSEEEVAAEIERTRAKIEAFERLKRADNPRAE